MLLTDYFRAKPDSTWDIALQCGVNHGVIRLPEEDDFDFRSASHWNTVYDRFAERGITPVIIEPMPNCLHDHIKIGDEKRDESIEGVISMFPHMERLGIGGICFNFMAHIGWLRTSSRVPERGGALVTEYNAKDFTPGDKAITSAKLWANYEYFLRAVLPEAEKHGIRLMLHPDDPPVSPLGNVERILVSRDAIRKAVYEICPSESLGITFCQANYYIMGEDLEATIDEFAKKIWFIHFRNTTGTPEHFRETFHDNGEMDMAGLMRAYIRNGIDVPIRVDHVPTLAGEIQNVPGYDTLGRLFAIGYLKGILDAYK